MDGPCMAGRMYGPTPAEPPAPKLATNAAAKLPNVTGTHIVLLARHVTPSDKQPILAWHATMFRVRLR